MSVRRSLRQLRAPDELGAEQRAWTIVRSAYADRAPAVKRGSRRRLLVLPVAVVLAGGLALSPAGANVRHWIGHTLGIAHPASALFSLPARGSLLVSGPGGTSTIAADGSARRLGRWRQASWSPHGMFIAVAGTDALSAVDPQGAMRWTLARPEVSDPSWYPPTGLRIAYLSGRDLRVVAGDGSGDRLLVADVADVAPAWRPDHPYQLAYVDHADRLVVRDAASGRVIWTALPPSRPRELGWSNDGTQLLVLTRSRALRYGDGGELTAAIAMPRNTPILDGSLSPNGQALALVRGGVGDDVVLANFATHKRRLRRVLSGDGLQQLVWSPNGRWLLVSWPLADQWVFIRVSGAPRIEAVSHINGQFAASAAKASPRIDGWCCEARGASG